MKGKQIKATLLIAVFIISTLAIAIPTASALYMDDLVDPEDHEVTLDSGPVGTEVTVLGETDYFSPFEIFWDSPTGVKLGEGYSDEDGDFEIDIVIPEDIAGDHYVIGVGIWYTDWMIFTITPEIVLTPTSGLPGDTVAVVGTGFAEDSDVGVFFDSNPAYLQTANDGIATWTTSEYKYGDYSVKLEPGPYQVGDWEDLDAARVVVPVASMILDDITSLSFWWKANGASGLPYVTIEMDKNYDGNADTWLIWNIGSSHDTTGATAWTQWTLATSPDDWHLASLVYPYADTGIWADMQSTYWDYAVLSCKVSIGEGSTSLVEPVYVDDIEINVDSFILELPLAESVTESLGSFEASFTVPDLTYDTYDVIAIDSSGNFNTTDFEVTATVTLVPDEGPTGTIVNVVGDGFLGTEVNVTFAAGTPYEVYMKNDIPLTLETFATSFRVPTVPVGIYTIKANSTLTEATATLAASKSSQSPTW